MNLKLQTQMQDWKAGDGDEPGEYPFWPIAFEIRDDGIFVKATDPAGDVRQVWIKISGEALVVHAYDPEHEKPINVRIGAAATTIDTDR